MIMKNNHNHKSPPQAMPVMSSSSSSSSQCESTQPHTTTYIPTKLYVTNFPFTCTQRQIQDLFSQYGQVVECTLKKDYYAYILFTNVKSSLNAYKHANGLKMFGRKLTVHLATSKKSQSHLQNTHQLLASLNLLLNDLDEDHEIPFEQIPKIIHVRNFPETCTQQQVRDIFVQYGEIVECLILHDSYAFVHFKSALDARLALQSTNNQPFMNTNTNLLVQYSRSKFKLTTETTRQKEYRNSSDDEEYEDEYDDDKHDSSTTSIRTKLYVTNFPEDMDQDEMKQLFNQYGQVLECTIMWNQYAFVHFGSYSEAEKALNGIKGIQYKGYKISVQWSTSSKYQQPKQHVKQNVPENSIRILERPVKNDQSWASMINKTSPKEQNVNTISNNKSTQPFKISFSEIVRSTGPVIKKVENEPEKVSPKPEEPLVQETPIPDEVKDEIVEANVVEKPGPIGTLNKSHQTRQIPVQKRPIQPVQTPVVPIPHFHYGQTVMYDNNMMVNPHHPHPSHHMHVPQPPPPYDYQHNYFNPAPVEMYLNTHHPYHVPQIQNQYPNYYPNQYPSMMNQPNPQPPLLSQPPYFYNQPMMTHQPPPPPPPPQPVWNEQSIDQFGLDRNLPQKENLIAPVNPGLLMKQTGLLTNGFANLTISSVPSTSSRSSSSSSSSSNNFIANSASNSASSTPTANQIKLEPKSDPNGLSSLFNSYVLFPSDSFDLSNDRESDERQLNNQQQFYQIEDVLANLIR